MNIRITLFQYDSAAYRDAVALRYDVLRKPLGMCFTDEQLAAERDALHYAAYVQAPSGVERMMGTALLLPRSEDRVQLRQMAVAPRVQGAGVGRALLQYVEHDARARGFKEVIAEARVSALSFYLKAGYIASGDVYEHVGLPHRMIAKRLD